MVRTLLVIAVLGLFSCEPTAPRCDSTTCFGCCDATGQCQGGGATDACGAQGNRCDVCVGSQTCALGRCQAPSCLPANCAALGFDCGQAEDGCGGVLECGSCGVGRTCGGGGRRNVCAPGVCTPASCAALNAECGRVSDGCAALLTCGSCSAGSSCGLNAPNRCACRPTTCSTLGRECGEVSDGCSAMLSCGSCSGGRTCGGGGAPGICGTGSCTPKTCAELSKECGSVSDGCGGMLACGSCSGALSCGGGGTPNVCGATCGNGCPSGFSCDPRGVCTGSSSSLVLNVLAVPVSGTVRLNGAAPVRGSSCSSSTSSSGYVTFIDAVTGTQLRADTSCSSANFAFNLTVPPGTYKVSVYNFGPAYSNLPDGLSAVNPALVVSGAVSALDLNVLAVPVSGTVRLNGAAPVRGSSCSSSTSSSGYVTFANEVTGTQLRADTSCSSANFAFNLTVPPGTYKVSVYNFGPAYSNLPEGLSGVVNQLRLQ
ncbi:MAG: hypothetical protein Q8N23_18250 [Archangium sp.]|nr:hypothetical protein [Archangium sp.]